MTIAIVIVAIVAVDFVLAIAAFRFVVARAWRPFESRFPPTPTTPDAVVRTAQTFIIDRLPFARAFDVAVDEACLHLTPRRLWRLVGARPISVPWEAVVPDPGPESPRWRTVTIDGVPMAGPRWCLDLAAR
ncbi:MAG: hypothetical protein HKO59_16610 [Phycisphaerales bacterium]|nr:hypothetical protein [Phycisphaerae bacterium]NNF42183.1 hypothetical protein [Phycisphaerales bacterium]NNM27572.1 hypothetical protein [Phycisphaerales bacterium]